MAHSEAPRRTALVVDDDPAILSLLEDVLVEAGFDTVCFPRGEPALAALAERAFDVMVIDINLPDMNGLQICEAGRARWGNDVTILVITADSRKHRSVVALEIGADDFVGKPFHIEELLARIETKLARKPGPFSHSR